MGPFLCLPAARCDFSFEQPQPVVIIGQDTPYDRMVQFIAWNEGIVAPEPLASYLIDTLKLVSSPK
jgi:hypothetical protein